MGSKRGYHLVGLRLFYDLIHRRQGSGKQFVVGIDKHHVLALSLFHTSSAGGCHTAIIFMDDSDALVLSSPLVADVARVVSAAVADTDDLETVEVLLQQTFQASVNVVSLVVDGYDNRYFHILCFLLPYELQTLFENSYVQKSHDHKVECSSHNNTRQ